VKNVLMLNVLRRNYFLLNLVILADQDKYKLYVNLFQIMSLLMNHFRFVIILQDIKIVVKSKRSGFLRNVKQN